MVTVWCPNCGEEFSEGVTVCPDCGVETMTAEVIPGPAAAPAHVEVPDGYSLLAGEWEGSTSEFVEWLDDEGIPVLTVAQPDGSMKLYVPQGDRARADELLQEYHDDDYEEVEVEFDEDDLSARSRELLEEGDLDQFGMLDDGPEEEMLELADRLEEAGVPVLVVDVEGEEGMCEVHVPDRCRPQATEIVAS